MCLAWSGIAAAIPDLRADAPSNVGVPACVGQNCAALVLANEWASRPRSPTTLNRYEGLGACWSEDRRYGKRTKHPKLRPPADWMERGRSLREPGLSSNLRGVCSPQFETNPSGFHLLPEISAQSLILNGEPVTIRYRLNRRAKNYVLTVRPDRTVTVTIPRRGSRAGAERFVQSRHRWIARTMERLRDRPVPPQIWESGTEVLFRGRLAPLRLEERGGRWWAGLDGEVFPIGGAGADLRTEVERHLRRLAEQELTPRVWEFALRHQCQVRRVTVRDQRSRWGSCSRRGTISLNWRLIQLPDGIRDYIILHEVMHLRVMNHSDRFWTEVKRVCPDYEAAEQWLKKHGPLLGL